MQSEETGESLSRQGTDYKWLFTAPDFSPPGRGGGARSGGGEQASRFRDAVVFDGEDDQCCGGDRPDRPHVHRRVCLCFSSVVRAPPAVSAQSRHPDVADSGWSNTAVCKVFSMSYDLVFVPRADEESWETALEAAEQDESATAPDPEVWARILAGARQFLGVVSVFEGDENFELTHEATGIQVSYFGGEASVTAPYWYQGEAARDVVDKIYRLGAVVQTETGLPGYDPQLDLSLSDGAERPDLAVSCFDQVSSAFAADS